MNDEREGVFPVRLHSVYASVGGMLFFVENGWHVSFIEAYYSIIWLV